MFQLPGPPGRVPLLALIAGSVLASATLPAAHAASSVAEAGAGKPEVTLLRLLNAARLEHSSPALRVDRRLARAARRHSRDMVVRRYFAHDSRSGARFSARIARQGWMRGRPRWRVGENLAWGTGRPAQPGPIVSAWLRSRAHRRILLEPRFRVVGIGIVAGTPTGDRRVGRTYTTDFGS